MQQRLIEAEEIRKQNAEVDRKLKKERDDKIKEQKEKANKALYFPVLSIVFPLADCGVDRRQELGGGVAG